MVTAILSMLCLLLLALIPADLLLLVPALVLRQLQLRLRLTLPWLRWPGP